MFSVREEKIIKVLDDKEMTIKKIAEKVFRNDIKPFDAEISIGNTIRRINEKCEYYKLDWRITKRREGNTFKYEKEMM